MSVITDKTKDKLETTNKKKDTKTTQQKNLKHAFRNI